MSILRFKPLLVRRQLPRLIFFLAIVLLLVSYYRCSPYVCPPRTTLSEEGGYPEGGTQDADDTVSIKHDPPPKSAPPSKAAVVASLKGDDTSWLHEYFPDWQPNIYVMNDRKAKLTVAKNKGRESMAYLTYIIDNYDNLPEYMVFLHSLRYQWHNEDPMYDGVPPLQNLQLPHVKKEGYANMRCTWVLGCPNEISPRRAITKVEAAFEPDNNRANTEASYAKAFQELFPKQPVPDEVGIQCGAQFALARWKVLARPKADYVHYRNWLWKTPLEDNVSGRILEYSWHMIMGKPSVYCPAAEHCFCDKFGLCNLTCTEDGCDKRYQLPLYATIPENWPEEGPGEDGFPADGWWL